MDQKKAGNRKPESDQIIICMFTELKESLIKDVKKHMLIIMHRIENINKNKF